MGYQRRVHGGTTQANVRPIPVLLIVLAGSYSCAALSSETDVVVPETFGHREAFANLPAADFIQTVSSSGGSEADCEKFADDTITDIKATVNEQQKFVDAVPNGDLCAAEGQKEVITAKNATETAKTEAKAAEKASEDAEVDEGRLCAAPVDLPTVDLNLLQNSCFNYEGTSAYEAAKRKCEDATEAVKEAKEAAKEAKEAKEAREDEQEEEEKEAQRLKSGCLCDTHQRQTEIQAAKEEATSTHQSEWTRAHKVLCALKQTPECDIPPCPTVTQPTLAAGVANADTQHCTAAPTAEPTAAPTTLADREEALRDCNAVSAGDTSKTVFFWHYGTVKPVFEFSAKNSATWSDFGASVESFPNWWHSSVWSAGNFNYDIAAVVNGIRVKTYNEPAIKPPLPTSAEEVDKLCAN